jgi:acyl-CoA reductase-like NAD-dependent aldehyde dehydrogenase
LSSTVPVELTYGTFVGGRWREPARTFPTLDPAHDGRVLAHCAAASPADVREAFAVAREAAPAWAATPPIERGELLHRTAGGLAARSRELAETLTREEGKTLRESEAEIGRTVSVLRWFAGEAAQPLGSVHPSASPRTLLLSMREPLGVVSVITPWNFPFAIPAWKIAPALAFGNTVVWKPSEVTPLCAALLVEAFEEAGVPAGVLNMVTGLPADIGDAVTSDPEIDAITFTGSLAVGRGIQTRAVPRGVKVQLETGGKNPVIVLDDADLDRAVELTVRGAMWAAGQKCTATSRALVLPRVAAAFKERLTERVRALHVGDPLDDAVEVGPLASEAQLEKVLGYLEIGRDEASRAVGGAGIPGEGHFVAPTVYLDVDPESRLGQDEIFGPVVGVIDVEDLDEALSVANGVRYGLSASIFTRDLGRALEFVRSIRAGMVHVNRETPGAEPQAPFGGMKDSSSHSREQGKASAEFFTELKTVAIDP